jgi:hypothetical protein
MRLHEVGEAFGFETVFKAIFDAQQRASDNIRRNIVRGFHRRIDFDEQSDEPDAASEHPGLRSTG